MSIININVFAFNDFTAAIQSAQAGDTINFFIQNDIVFPSAAGITKTLAINLIDAGSGNVTLSVPAGDTFRHFTTGTSIPGVSMTVGSDIILNGGGTGGGLFIFGSNCTVTLNGCTFSNCRSALNGGAVQIVGDTSRSTLIINNETIITNCFATFGGGVVASGCDVTLNGGTITGNTAGNAGGGMSIDGRSAALGSTLTVNGGAITGNTVIVNDGGGINAQNTIITILGGEISNNTGMGFGGGIHLFSSIVAQSALRINGGAIIGNRTRNFGGGIAVQSRVNEVTMTGGLITQNSATIAGGSNQGGGIFVQEGNTFEMSGGRIFDNTAGSGGGIFLNNATLNLNGTAEVSENEAAASAGGIFGFQGCTVNVFGDAKVINNRALSSGDPERQDRGGGGIAILSFGTTSTATIRDNVIISGNSSASYGGGIWTYPNFGPAPLVNIEGGTIENNSANYGGGISAIGALVAAANCAITNNTAGKDGGGIFTDQLVNVTVSASVIFSGNLAATYAYWNVTSGGDSDIYKTHIFTGHFSTFIPDQTPPPEIWFFLNAYNNYDINYVKALKTVTVNFVDADNHGHIIHQAIINSFVGATIIIPPRESLVDENGNVWLLSPPDQPAQTIELTDPDADYVVTFFYAMQEVCMCRCRCCKVKCGKRLIVHSD